MRHKQTPSAYLNDNWQQAALTTSLQIVLPRHLFLEQLRKLSVREDSCTLCFDMKASVRIEPCQHRGFCTNCAALLQFCPMCRAEIVSTVHEEIAPDSSPHSEVAQTDPNVGEAEPTTTTTN